MTDTSTRSNLTRRVLAAITLVVPLLVVFVSWLLLRDRLPSQLASHWSGLGTADGVMPAAETLTISLVMSGAAAVAGIVIAFWPGMSAMLRRGAFFFVGVFAGIGASTWLLSAGLTLQAGGDPYEAVLGGWIIALAVSAGYGVFPFLLAPRPLLERSGCPLRRARPARGRARSPARSSSGQLSSVSSSVS